MTTTFEFRPMLSMANPAALVAAWLYDALSAAAAVELATVQPDLVVLLIDPPDARLPFRRIVANALSESRFAGWELMPDSRPLHSVAHRSSAISHAHR